MFLLSIVNNEARTRLDCLKVLIAATVASVIGQLSKPFTSGGDGGKIDIVRVAARSGGMPSTHSAVRLSSLAFASFSLSRCCLTSTGVVYRPCFWGKVVLLHALSCVLWVK